MLRSSRSCFACLACGSRSERASRSMIARFLLQVTKRFSPRAGSLFSTFGPSERSPKVGFMLEWLPEAFFGGPRAPQEPPRAPQEPPREPPRAAPERPKSRQDGPKSAPRAVKRGPRPPRRRQEAPRSLQEPFWPDFGASGDHFEARDRYSRHSRLRSAPSFARQRGRNSIIQCYRSTWPK